jgi:hypothetical protein
LGRLQTYLQMSSEGYKRKVLLSRINQAYYCEEYFARHTNIKTKLKQRVITKVINLIKLGGLGGKACSSN